MYRSTLVAFLTSIIVFGVASLPAHGQTESDQTKHVAQIYLLGKDKQSRWAIVQTGSGVFIRDPQKPTGRHYVVTNAHVIAMPEAFEQDAIDINTALMVCQTMTNTKQPFCWLGAIVVQEDENRDLALLEVTEGSKGGGVSLPDDVGVHIATSTPMTIGQDIRFFGYPAAGSESITLTRGVVSGFLDRGATSLIKTDAQLNPGNSGGGAFDGQGNFVGLALAISADAGGALGYAIPASSVFQWVEAILRTPDDVRYGYGVIPPGFSATFGQAASFRRQDDTAENVLTPFSLPLYNAREEHLASVDFVHHAGWTPGEVQEGILGLQKVSDSGAVLGRIVFSIFSTPYALSDATFDVYVRKQIQEIFNDVDDRYIRFTGARPGIPLVGGSGSERVRSTPFSIQAPERTVFGSAVAAGRTFVIIFGVNPGKDAQVTQQLQFMQFPQRIEIFKRDGEEHTYENDAVSRRVGINAEYPPIAFSLTNEWFVERSNSLKEPAAFFHTSSLMRPVTMKIVKKADAFARVTEADAMQRIMKAKEARVTQLDPSALIRLAGVQTLHGIEMYAMEEEYTLGVQQKKEAALTDIFFRNGYLIELSIAGRTLAELYPLMASFRTSVTSFRAEGSFDPVDTSLQRLTADDQGGRPGTPSLTTGTTPGVSDFRDRATIYATQAYEKKIYAYKKGRLKDRKEEERLQKELRAKLTEKLRIVGKQPAFDEKTWTHFAKAYVYGEYSIEEVFRSLVEPGIVHRSLPAFAWRKQEGYLRPWTKVSSLDFIGTDVKGTRLIPKNDSDGDGLPDLYETMIANSDPKKKDTDGDGYSDGEEVRSGHSPLQPAAQKKQKKTLPVKKKSGKRK